MTDRVLVGPLLTRSEAATMAGVPAEALPYRPDLVKIGGRHLQEAYCRFQFGPAGIRTDVGGVVLAMQGRWDDLTIADWLVRGNPALRGESPLDRLNRTHSLAEVLDALALDPPRVVPEPARAQPSIPQLAHSVEFRRPSWRWARRPGTIH